ncbi:MAG: cytidylyltransferase domain-containing protein [Flavobacteriales bacterium]
MRIIAIIPARGGSKRLLGKNVFLLKGKPLIQYTIEACNASRFVQHVFVSSEDDTILNVATELGATSLKRPPELADDQTPKVVAIRQAAKDPAVGLLGKDDIVVIPQANSPQISASQMDQGIQLLLDHALWEVMSCDENGVQNAAFRIVRYHALFNSFLSAHCGFVIAKNLDVHTLDDIQRLESGD